MKGIDGLLKKLEGMKNVQEDMHRIMDNAGVFVRDEARLRAPVDTGDLRKSIQHTTRDTGESIMTVVHTNSDHAAAVELGTGPVGAAHHEGISPDVTPMYRPDKWLGKIPGLESENDSGLRYIAGQRAQPYLYPSLKDNEKQLLEYMGKELREVIRRQSGND